MKKLLLSLGSVVALVAPITTVIACIPTTAPFELKTIISTKSISDLKKVKASDITSLTTTLEKLGISSDSDLEDSWSFIWNPTSLELKISPIMSPKDIVYKIENSESKYYNEIAKLYSKVAFDKIKFKALKLAIKTFNDASVKVPSDISESERVTTLLKDQIIIAQLFYRKNSEDNIAFIGPTESTLAGDTDVSVDYNASSEGIETNKFFGIRLISSSENIKLNDWEEIPNTFKGYTTIADAYNALNIHELT